MEEKGHFINALPDSGLVTLLGVLRDRELRPRRSGGVYLHLLLGDRTGEIAGRVWDGAEEIARLFVADDVVKVRGTLERYNGNSQLIVQRVRRCREEYGRNEGQPARFFPSPIGPEIDFFEERFRLAHQANELLPEVGNAVGLSNPPIPNPPAPAISQAPCRSSLAGS
jgi:OB-fold nucleic acid binding domain